MCRIQLVLVDSESDSERGPAQTHVCQQCADICSLFAVIAVFLTASVCLSEERAVLCVHTANRGIFLY